MEGADNDDASRRSFLKTTGTAAVVAASVGTTAGCMSNQPEDGEDGDDGEDGNDGSDGEDGGDGGSSGGTLRYGRGAHSSTLDPQNSTSGEVAKVTNQIYDGLLGFEPGGSALVESLATDWEMDGDSVTLTLRQDAQFADGTEFTAEDFIATYRRFVDEDYEYNFPEASAYGSLMLGNWIDSVEADGDYALNITLNNTYAPFLRNLAMFATAVLPKDGIESGFDFNADANGTGPFQLDQLDDANGRIRLVPNENYWGEGPHVDELLFLEYGEPNTRAQALAEGETEIVDTLNPSAISIVEGAGNASVVSQQGINIGYMGFNLSRVEEFRDVRVRQAISHAINTEAIVNEVYSGIADQASQPCPPAITFGHNDDLSPYEYDTDKAQSLLEEAGYGDGFSFTLTTFQNSRGYNPAPTSTAETIRTNLSDVGIDVTIDDRPFADFLEYTGAGNHDALTLGWYTDNADPDNFYYALLHPQVEPPEGQDYIDSFDVEGYNTSNRTAWANTEFMDLVEQGQQTAAQDERQELYYQAAEIAHEQAPWVYIDYAQEIRGVHDKVSNYTVSAISGPHLHLVSVE